MVLINRGDGRLARGIIIRPGDSARTGNAFWAYLWSADDDPTGGRWHERVPVHAVPVGTWSHTHRE